MHTPTLRLIMRKAWRLAREGYQCLVTLMMTVSIIRKKVFRGDGIIIFDCDDDNSIEDQVFIDLPWTNVLELVDYAATAHSKTTAQIENVIIENYHRDNLPGDWRNNETLQLRIAIALASQHKHLKGERKKNRKPWFKRIDHGEKLGEIIFNNFGAIEDGKRIKEMFTELSDWIDG